MKMRFGAVAGLFVALASAATAAAENPPAKAAAARTVYVPLAKGCASRAEAIRLTAALQEAIKRETPLKLVGSPAKADLILEVRPAPAGQRAR